MVIYSPSTDPREKIRLAMKGKAPAAVGAGVQAALGTPAPVFTPMNYEQAAMSGNPTRKALGTPPMSPANPAPTIAPPQITDWAAAVKNPQSLIPQPPAQSPAQDLGPGRAEAAVQGNIQNVDRVRMIQRLRSERGIAVNQPYAQLSPEDQASRRDFIRTSGHGISDLEGMARPSQQVQTPDQIAQARAGINLATVKNGLSKGPINPSEAGGYGSTSKLMDRVSGAQSAADSVLPRIGGQVGPDGTATDPRTAAIVRAQQELRDRQDAARGGAEYRAGPLMRSAQYQREEGGNQARFAVQMAEKQRELGLAGANTTLAQTRQAGAEATASSDPSVIRSMIEAKQRQAQAGAIGAGANVSTATGQAAGATRTSALQQAGISEDEVAQHAKLIDSLSGAMSSLATGSVSGGLLGGAEDTMKSAGIVRNFVGHIEQIPDPQTKAIIARDLLAHMPPPNPKTGRYDVWSAVSGFRTQSRQVAAGHMNDIYQRLTALAGSQ